MPSVSEGTIPFSVQGETYATWYKLFGARSSTRHALVVLHGGPGLSHDYMAPLADLSFLTPSIPVIFYDQLGTARSKDGRLSEKDVAFWTIEIFVAELENLLVHLGISDSFDLLGHSWGATLATEFVVRRQPVGLKRLILSNALASAKLRNESIARLRKTLPSDVQDALDRNEEAKTTDSPEYKIAIRSFHEHFGCRLKPLPREMAYSLGQVDLEGQMVQRGILDNGMADEWSIIDRIHLIRVPTLLINGKYDFMSDQVCMPFFHHIEKVKWVQFASSSHTPHWEERELYTSVVHSFLSDSELDY